MNMRILTLAGAVLAGLLPVAAQAADADASAWLLGDWDGARTRLHESGVDFQLGWTNETAHNGTGGERSLTRSAGQFVLGTTLDLERLWNWRGARFQITADKRYGRNIADEAGIGVAMNAHEIYGRGQTWWLTDFYLEQTLADGRVSLRAGKMPVGSDFGYDECHFLNTTACGSTPGNMEGRYWYNWPIGSWGLRAQVDLSADTYLKAGIYQVGARYVDDAWARDNGWKIINPGTDGALVPVEFGWTPHLAGLAGHYRLGGWVSSAGGDDLYLNRDGLPLGSAGGEALHRDRSRGAYLSLKQQLTGSTDGTGLHAFLNLTRIDGRTARYDAQAVAGVFYQGLPWRPADSAGLMIGATSVSDRYTRYARLWNAYHPGERIFPSGGSEKVTEAFYQFTPIPSLSLRPSVQYIVNPGGDTGRHDAVIFGLKTDIAF